MLGVGRSRVVSILKYAWENNDNLRPECQGGKREKDGYSELKEEIRRHIQLFRCVQSHYGRYKTPHRRYLPSTLSVFKMYELFLEQYKGALQVKYSLYYTIFVEDFNLGFGSPKTDICSYCIAHETLLRQENNNDKKRIILTELLVHKARARKFYSLMSEKHESSTLVLSFDLMQTLPLPKTLDWGGLLCTATLDLCFRDHHP